MEVEMTETQLLQIGFSKKFLGKSLKNFLGNSKERKVVRSYMKYMKSKASKGEGLLIQGADQSGKSLLANLIGMSALAYGFKVQLLSLSELTALKFDTGNFDETAFDEILGIDFLIIDGLKLEHQADKYAINDGMVAAFYDVLKFRDKQVLPTVVTTRMTDIEIEKTFGDSVMGLLEENFMPLDCIRVAKWKRKRVRDDDGTDE